MLFRLDGPFPCYRSIFSLSYSRCFPAALSAPFARLSWPVQYLIFSALPARFPEVTGNYFSFQGACPRSRGPVSRFNLRRFDLGLTPLTIWSIA